MASIKVSLRKKGDTKGYHQIQVIYTHKSKKFPVSIGKIPQRFWDEDSQKVHADHIQAKSMNQQISDQIEWFDKKRRILENKGFDPSVQAMRSIDNEKRSKEKDLLEVLEDYHNYELRRGSEASASRTKTLKFILTKYIEQNGPLPFPMINFEFRDKFQTSCLNGDITLFDGVVNSTFKNYIKQMVQFLKWAEMDGYRVNPNYKFFLRKTTDQLSAVEKEKPFLLPDEVDALYKVKGFERTFEDFHKAKRTVDALIFNSGVGMRFNDLEKLKVGQLEYGEHGWVLSRLTRKEKTRTMVLLSGVSEEIFLNYSKGKGKNDFLFGKIYDNSQANGILKKWARLASLNREFRQEWTKGKEIITQTRPLHEVITTHCMRVTKATNFIYDSINKHGMCDPYLLCRVVGWKNILTAERYIKSVSSILVDQQAKLLT